MFDNLSKKISAIFDSLKSHGVLTQEIIEKSVREIRISLLEADVALPVVKALSTSLSEKLIGKPIAVGVSPWQMINKHLNDEFLALFGQSKTSLNKGDILLCGLQGTGKTTTAAKIAKLLNSQNVLLVSLDTYRPAAIDQLKKLAALNNLQFFDDFDLHYDNPVTIAERVSKITGFERVIYDSAGRSDVDLKMMDELKNVYNIICPANTLFVVDSMAGQSALKTAEAFADTIDITGLVMTKADGDSKGGAIISAKYVTKAQVLYICNGEKINDIEIFDPQKITSRILDNHDILSSIDDALKEGIAEVDFSTDFTLDSMEKYLLQASKIKNISWLFGIIPGLKKFKDKIMHGIADKTIIMRDVAIIRSMTKKERRNYKLLDASRKKRIAAGSGCQVADINRLIKQYEQIKTIFQKMKRLKAK